MPLTTLSFRVMLTLFLLLAGPATWADGDKNEKESVHRDVHQHLHKVAPRVEIRGVHPNFHWVGMGGGFIGVGLSDLTPELLQHFGVKADGGVMINRVDEKGPAAAAGLVVGDVITRAGGEPILNPFEFARVVRNLEEGTQLDLEYWRDGRLETTTAIVEGREIDPTHVIDLGAFEDFKGFEHLKHLEAIGPEVMEQVQRSLEQVMDKDWQIDLEKHLEGLQDINLEGLEERMEELRERMKELEERLEEQYGDSGGSV